LNFVFRTGFINDRGVCVIGMKKFAMIPLISFDVVVNVYLTMLFLVPLRGLYSYQHNTNVRVRRMAVRTFFGSCATLTSSVANLTVLMVLEGEPGWICLMCCNADILFSVLVLHWVTSIDASRSNRNSRSGLVPHINGSFASNRHDIETARRNSHPVATKIVGDNVCDRPREDMPANAITVTTDHTWEVVLDDTSKTTIGTGEEDLAVLQLRNSSTDAVLSE